MKRPAKLFEYVDRSKQLTVGKLRAALSSVPDDTPIAIPDAGLDGYSTVGHVHYDGRAVLLR